MIDLFKYQYENCKPYKKWCDLLNKTPQNVTESNQIPFLPIELFRTHKIYCPQTAPELMFSSSGTTSENTSTHHVASAQRYIDTFSSGFREFYGEPKEWSIFALLPKYLERPNSSLAYMVQQLQKENRTKGGFYLNNLKELYDDLVEAIKNKEKIMLIGVTFALLDFCEAYRLALPENAVVMETGGMKNQREEIERTELHEILSKALGVKQIHSEYGMTELLSQAYSSGNGLFRPSSSMIVVGRELVNPLQTGVTNKPCGLNIVDLANSESCAFIATADKGIVYENGEFEVHGRIENEILRGCNMLA